MIDQSLIAYADEQGMVRAIFINDFFVEARISENPVQIVDSLIVVNHAGKASLLKHSVSKG